MQANYSRPPFFLGYRCSKTFITTVVSVAAFTDVAVYALIIPVSPFALRIRAGVPEGRVQYWVAGLLAIYGGASVLGCFVSGCFAGRRHARRVLYLGGVVTLFGSTASLCFGTTLWLFLLGRALQGFSCAITWAVDLVIVADCVGQQEIGKAMGVVSMTIPLAMLCAPTLGGILYERQGYSAVMAVMFALAGVDLLLRMATIEKSVAVQWLEPTVKETLDIELALELADRGVYDAKKVASSIHVVELSPALARPSDQGCSIFRTAVSALRVLMNPRLLANLWGCFIQTGLMCVFDAVLPLLVMQVFGWNALKAGLSFIPLLLPCVLIDPIAGFLSDRHGSRLLAGGGFILTIPCLISLRFVTHDSPHQIGLLMGLLLFNGLALAFILPCLMADISRAVEAQEGTDGANGSTGVYAQAYGLFACSQAAGMLLLPLFAAMLKERYGWSTMTWALAILSGLSGVPIFLFVGDKEKEKVSGSSIN
ncbi:major facilitator superfamily domain-containing protein [Cryomyces antarcticus]